MHSTTVLVPRQQVPADALFDTQESKESLYATTQPIRRNQRVSISEKHLPHPQVTPTFIKKEASRSRELFHKDKRALRVRNHIRFTTENDPSKSIDSHSEETLTQHLDCMRNLNRPAIHLSLKKSTPAPSSTDSIESAQTRPFGSVSAPLAPTPALRLRAQSKGQRSVPLAGAKSQGKSATAANPAATSRATPVAAVVAVESASSHDTSQKQSLQRGHHRRAHHHHHHHHHHQQQHQLPNQHQQRVGKDVHAQAQTEQVRSAVGRPTKHLYITTTAEHFRRLESLRTDPADAAVTLPQRRSRGSYEAFREAAGVEASHPQEIPSVNEVYPNRPASEVRKRIKVETVSQLLARRLAAESNSTDAVHAHLDTVTDTYRCVHGGSIRSLSISANPRPLFHPGPNHSKPARNPGSYQRNKRRHNVQGSERAQADRHRHAASHEQKRSGLPTHRPMIITLVRSKGATSPANRPKTPPTFLQSADPLTNADLGPSDFDLGQSQRNGLQSPNLPHPAICTQCSEGHDHSQHSKEHHELPLTDRQVPQSPVVAATLAVSTPGRASSGKTFATSGSRARYYLCSTDCVKCWARYNFRYSFYHHREDNTLAAHMDMCHNGEDDSSAPFNFVEDFDHLYDDEADTDRINVMEIDLSSGDEQIEMELVTADEDEDSEFPSDEDSDHMRVECTSASASCSDSECESSLPCMMHSSVHLHEDIHACPVQP